MSDAAVVSATEVTPHIGAPKKKAAKKAKETKTKERAKPTHPKTSDMVTAAITDLKERGGSSLQAIKKYIATNYKLDAEKMAPFIRKYLKAAVTSGTLVQTKGKGASGSFKLAGKGTTAEKKQSTKKVKSPPTKVKKAAASPKKSTMKPKSKTAPASPSKTKKAAKAPTTKPKAPKPKKAVPKAQKKAPAKK